MPFESSQTLDRLAEIFTPKTTLYAVGGCVRDGEMDIACKDLDICSSMSVENVKELLSGTEFFVSDKSLRMGTVIIATHGFRAEYTSFRTDSYDLTSGKHYPDQVLFTTDIRLDALRRDFKCNALYYDIHRRELVDPLGGLDDIKNKILSAADSPDSVFEADGLRVLRLVRFAAELGFDIEEETFRSAKANAWRVKDLSAERVRDELNRIFVADTRHPELNLKNAHLRGFKLLDELGLIDIILPELASLKGLEQPKIYHLYDAYDHCVKAYEVAPPHLRWAALLHDVGKKKSVDICGKMYMHGELGAEMTRDIMNRLKFPKAETSRTVRLVALHMTDINGDESMQKLKRIVIQNADLIDDLCELIVVDGIASAGEINRTHRLRIALDELRANGSPFSVKELKIDGRDLIEMGIPEKDRGALLVDLLYETAMNPLLNDRDRALAYVKRRFEKTKKQV